jgi:hypothetical protein
VLKQDATRKATLQDLPARALLLLLLAYYYYYYFYTATTASQVRQLTRLRRLYLCVHGVEIASTESACEGAMEALPPLGVAHLLLMHRKTNNPRRVRGSSGSSIHRRSILGPQWCPHIDILIAFRIRVTHREQQALALP